MAWFSFWSICTLLAQSSVSGVVTDSETGDPLIGASVLVVETGTGTVTDIDGKYTVTADVGGELQFSYTGYKTQTVFVDSRTTIDVQLLPGELLDEVVVVGYGAVKKDDLTGSVNTIDAETFNQGAIVSPTNLISGKVAGVQILSGDGQPGGGTSIRIRGGTSVTASNEPLYVVDGVPLSGEGGGVTGGRNALNFLNPGDIESMTILKDASASAIYGSRGANGVVIITTKQGESGAPRITYDGRYFISNAIGEGQFLDAESFRNTVTFAAPSRLELLGDANTNWYDESLQTATGTQHDLSVSGGGETNTYRVSLGYQFLEGVVRGADTERISLNLNFVQRALNDKLTITTSLKGNVANNNFDNGPLGAALTFDPTQPIFDPSNIEYAGYNEYDLALAPRNPISTIEQITNEGTAYRAIGSIDLNYDFDDLIPGLSFKTILGFDIEDGQSQRFVPRTYATFTASGFDGEFNRENQRRDSRLLDAYFTYTKPIGGSEISLLAGYSYQDFNNSGSSINGQNLETDAFGANNINVAEDLLVDNYVFENRLISFFGRLNVNLGEKYLVTASLRRDGSSRFGEANRWGLFPSAAVAWRVLEEPWAAGLSNTFSTLKFRVGYGVIGNQDFDDYQFLPTYQFGDQRVRYQFGDEFVTTVRANAYDAGLKWEETAMINLGIDFGFLNNRISGILEFYQKTTDDLIFTVNVPAGTNLSDRVTTNIGALENRGVELTLNAVVVDKPNFGFDLTGNIAFNQNEITRLDGQGSADIQRGDIAGGVGNTAQILRVGEPVNSFYLYEQRYDANGRPINDNGNELIDMYVDQNGDGMINDQDLRVIEQPAGDILYGITGSARFKKFTFDFTLRGSVGNYVYNNTASSRGFLNQIDIQNGYVNNVHPSAVFTRFQDAQFFSDYYLEDASFLRLDNVNLGYNFGQLGTSTLRLQLYATAQNLFTITGYSGLDPETDANGIDLDRFPRARTITLGARLSL
ncbi:MAG: TonB-dependent receptor [Bacteroidota bacterium]